MDAGAYQDVTDPSVYVKFRLYDGRDSVIEDEYEFDDQPWHIARAKEHPSEPMTVDDALHQMELVGHDFYLFQDKESGRPSVVYRRKGYDYGLLSLAP